MLNNSNRLAAAGVLAVCGAVPALWGVSASSAPDRFQSHTLWLAQADGTKGKSGNDRARPDTQAPRDLTPGNQAPVPASPMLQNAPQSGVPARCASVSDAAERQKCMNTPKGQ